MDATTGWSSVRQLRAWERERLRLRDGETLLDVGCGPGDAGIALVSAAGAQARLLGLDASEVMLSVARERAAEAAVPAEFLCGDAQRLPYKSESVDAVRSERTLQWLPDPNAALSELVRVLRRGSRLVVIDTDWDSLTVDLPDLSDFGALRTAMRTARGPGFTIGRQLLNRCRDAGLSDVACAAATQVLTSYDDNRPLESSGMLPLHAVAEAVISAGLLDSEVAERALSRFDAAGRADRMMLSLTIYAAYGRKP